ncbi:hypothetical protein [uncultured Methanobrevibacter sp.]|nr:hypothetical protein [uncultured Methanobrevibacter sp.]
MDEVNCHFMVIVFSSPIAASEFSVILVEDIFSWFHVDDDFSCIDECV